jgi:cytoskeletal protein CcmA (bactofilin family)
VTQRGKIIGNITAANLVMEPGALFEGQCNMNHRSGDEERDSQNLPAFPSAQKEDQPSSEAGG